MRSSILFFAITHYAKAESEPSSTGQSHFSIFDRRHKLSPRPSHQIQVFALRNGTTSLILISSADFAEDFTHISRVRLSPKIFHPQLEAAHVFANESPWVVIDDRDACHHQDR